MISCAKVVAALGILSTLIPGLSGPLYSQSAKQDTAASQSTDAGPSAAPAQNGLRVTIPKGKKIVLKDGSFQVAREYSVDSDRVRYWSVERSDWEEIPASLVDWEATHKAEAEQASHDAELKAKIRASEIAERTKDIDVDRSLEIKPGLFLPDDIGFFALDENRNILNMKQSTAGAHLSKSRETEKILTGIPLIPSKQSLEIPGTRAQMRFSTGEPEFYMRPADDREPRFRLIHLQVKNGHRTVEKVSVYMSGEEVHNADEVALQTWTPARGVFRYTVEKRLDPGEYAFVEMTKEGISGYVWDFGVDPPTAKPPK